MLLSPFFFFYFIYFIFGCIGSSLLRAGFLSLRPAGATLRCGARASHCGGFSCCGPWALGIRASLIVACGLRSCGSRVLEGRLSSCGARAPDAQAQQLWHTGLVAPWHVGSSQTRARTRVPCIGRQILNHCATREVPLIVILKNIFLTPS